MDRRPAVTDAGCRQCLRVAIEGDLLAVEQPRPRDNTLAQEKGFGPVGSAKHVILISDDGVAFEMCDIGSGWVNASASQPANLYAYWALQYAKDAATGVVLKAGEAGGGAPTGACQLRGRHQPGRPGRCSLCDQDRFEHLSITPVGGAAGDHDNAGATPTCGGTSMEKLMGESAPV